MTDRAKVCPREPTQEMLRHARLLPSFGVVDIWRAMYDAAPSAAPSDDALVLQLRRMEGESSSFNLRDLSMNAADRIEVLTAELSQARAKPCPHVVTSDEGTQHCNLGRVVGAGVESAARRHYRSRRGSGAGCATVSRCALRGLHHVAQCEGWYMKHADEVEEMNDIIAEANAALAEQEGK